MDSTSTILPTPDFGFHNDESQLWAGHDFLLADTLPSTVSVYSPGVVGDLIPYGLGNDDTVAIGLLTILILVAIATSRSWHFINRQTRTFLYTHHDNGTETETASDIRFQYIMAGIDLVLLTMIAFIYTEDYLANPYFHIDNYKLIGMILAMVIVYFILRWTATTMVNLTFFNSKKNIQWTYSQLFLTTIETVLMCPLVIALVYLGLSTEKGIIWFLAILILNKSLTFYKDWSIFFKQNGGVLQTILYFCALEITPLLAFGGAWRAMTNFLKVIF